MFCQGVRTTPAYDVEQCHGIAVDVLEVPVWCGDLDGNCHIFRMYSLWSYKNKQIIGGDADGKTCDQNR